MINFKGTSYLGLQDDPQFINLVQEGLHIYGTTNPTSRLSDYNFNEIELMEKNISGILSTEDTILFTSGYLAGLTAKSFFEYFAGKNSLPVIEAPRLHPCLKNDNSSLKVQEVGENHFIDYILKIKNSVANCILINNLVDSFTGFPEPVDVYFREIKPLWMVSDISHAFEVANISKILPAEIRGKTIFVSSTGKACGVPGGFISGNKEIIDHICKIMPVYSAAAPPPQAMAYAFNKSEDLRQKKRINLEKNIEEFEKKTGFYSQVTGKKEKFPIYCLGQNRDDIFSLLSEQGLFCSYLSYPTCTSPKYLRIVLNAAHTYEDIDKISSLLWKNNLKICTTSFPAPGRIIYL